MYLSFIVPAFNVELYIERCIDSICNQDVSEEMYEIIIINDGSTDGTSAKIEYLIKKYSNHNIKLINKPNGGLSSARNAGILHAKGEYLWFIDSDDYIANNCLCEIIDIIDSNREIEVFVFSTDYVYDNNNYTINRRRLPSMKILSGSELYLKDYRYPYSGAPFSIYKYSYLQTNSLKFKEGVLFEDLLYTTLLLASNPKCMNIDRIYYHYYMRSGSITKSKNTVKKCMDLLSIADDLYQNITFKDKYNPNILYDQIARNLAAIYRCRLVGLSLKDRLQVVKAINGRKYWRKAVFNSKKYKYIPYLIINKMLKLISNV